MFKRLKKKIKNKLNNYFNNLLDPKLNNIYSRIDLLNPKLNDIYNRIDFKKDESIDDISRLIKASIVNRETFGPYKDYCKGKKLVICGAGPSLNKYKPIPGAIHIALNRAFLFNKVHFDMIFSNDFKGVEKYQDELINYKNCIKFFGDYGVDLRENGIYPEEFARKNNAKRFYLEYKFDKAIAGQEKFVKDIEFEPLRAVINAGYIVLQFALYMNPSDIFLVGIDVQGNHFENKGYSKEELEKERITMEGWHKACDQLVIDYYKKFIDFINYHYPNIKIHSINPVGLKGLFEDIYQL